MGHGAEAATLAWCWWRWRSRARHRPRLMDAMLDEIGDRALMLNATRRAALYQALGFRTVGIFRQTGNWGREPCGARLPLRRPMRCLDGA